MMNDDDATDIYDMLTEHREKSEPNASFEGDVHVSFDEAPSLETNEAIAKAMTAMQLRNGQAIRNLLDMYFGRWCAETANKQGMGILDHFKLRARNDTAHVAIANDYLGRERLARRMVH